MDRLTELTQADSMLARIATAQDAIDVIDLAEAARVLAKEAHLGASAMNHATLIKLRAERKLADIVDEGQRTGAIATAGGDTTIPRPPGIAQVTPGDLGVSTQRLSEARKIRDAYTDADLIERAEQAAEADEALSRDRLIREARQPVERDEPENAAAIETTKEILHACRVLATRDLGLVSNYVSGLSGPEIATIQTQLKMARQALGELEKAIRST